MLKPIAAILLASLAGAASAATVTFGPEGCSANRFCSKVPNDAGITDLVLYANAADGGIVELFLPDGSYYIGRGAVGLSVVNYPVYRQPNNDAVIYVSADWTTWVTKGSGSGRGGYASHTHWALLGGSMLTP